MLERSKEIALLKAVGFNRSTIRRLITREYMILLLAGIGSGFITAIISTLPSILSPNTEASIITILVILLILIVNGWFWIFTVTSTLLKHQAIYRTLRNE